MARARGRSREQPKRDEGLKALRRKDSQLTNLAEMDEDEIALVNYAMMHGDPNCDSYCLRDVKNQKGEIIGQRCRMHAELKKKEFCCNCQDVLRGARCATTAATAV